MRFAAVNIALKLLQAGHCLPSLFNNTRVCVLATLQQIGDKVENAMRLVCFSVQCFASQCWLGSVVDNSGRELWNSCPEECSLLQCTVTEQRRADGLSFYPRVMWSIKPAAALPWMGRHTPAHHNLSLYIHPLLASLFSPKLEHSPPTPWHSPML